MTLTIELPETVTRELDEHQISSQQVRAFVVEAIEAWLRVQSVEKESLHKVPSCFRSSAVPFAEPLVKENRELFERLAQL